MGSLCAARRGRLLVPGSPSLGRAHTDDVKPLVASVAVTLLMTGCANPSVGPGTCRLRSVNSPAEVVSEPEIAEVPEHNANLVLDLSSSTSDAVQVTIRLNGKVALDVRTPAVPADCSHSPVYSHGFRLPSESARVTVTTDQSQRRSITVPLDGATRWVAVQPQDGLPIGLHAFDEEPAWG